MKKTMLPALLLATLLSGAASAAEKSKEPVVTAPPPPEELTQGEEVAPKVTIVRREWATIAEYSVGGQVYAVKISPTGGFPYYLYDSDGDGSLETRRDGEPELMQWKVLTW